MSSRAARQRSFLPCHNRKSQNKCLVQEAAARHKQHRQYDEERCQEHSSGNKQEEID